MTFDDLREQWQESNARIASQRKRELALVSVCRTVEKTNLAILRRDIIETIASVVVIIFFGIAMFSLPSWTAVAGAALIVVWAVFIIYKMNRTRMKNRTRDIDLSVREYYEGEAESIDQQIEMLRSVLWWYLLPAFVGVNLVFIGLSSSLLAPAMYFVAVLVLYTGIWWLNQRAVINDLLPVREKIGALLHELNETPDEQEPQP